MDELKVFAPGTEVLIAHGDIKATVLSVSIQGEMGSICWQYKVVWWTGNSREEKWLESFEVEPLNSKAGLTIGFSR